MTKRLAGKTAVISGAASGIGQASAVRLAADGAQVVIADRAKADETLKMIADGGAKALAVACDVSDPASVAALKSELEKNGGRCDILVNNAGMDKRADFWDVAEADYDKVLAVNLKGPFFLTQYFVQKLLAASKPGRIINISSVHEDMVFPHFATYCVSKGGLRMLMRDLAVELGPKNITINNIAPGAISTPINANLLNNKSELEALLKNIPLGRMGTVDDVAALTAFLASDEAAYITGSTYVIDGGLMRSYHEQ